MIDRSRAGLETYNEGHSRDEIVLEIENFATPNLAPLTFSVKAGEVLGITGPVGGGMEQVERALGGIAPHTGTIKIRGRAVSITSPSEARKIGDRDHSGRSAQASAVPNLSLADNVCLAVLYALEQSDF